MEIKCSSMGIGDMVCGSYIAQAIKDKYPEEEITYYVLKPIWLKHIKNISIKHYLNAPNSSITDVYIDDKQMRRSRYKKTTRKDLYLEKIPLTGLKPRQPKTGVTYNKYGSILLFPYSAWADREWSIDSWIALESRLYKTYKNVVVLGPMGSDVSMFINGVNTNEYEALGMVTNSRFVVGNDSGMVHVAGLYKIPTLSIINFFSSEYLFSHTNIESLHGFDRLNSIDVYDKIVKMISYKEMMEKYNLIESKIIIL